MPSDFSADGPPLLSRTAYVGEEHGQQHYLLAPGLTWTALRLAAESAWASYEPRYALPLAALGRRRDLYLMGFAVGYRLTEEAADR